MGSEANAVLLLKPCAMHYVINVPIILLEMRATLDRTYFSSHLRELLAREIERGVLSLTTQGYL